MSRQATAKLQGKKKKTYSKHTYMLKKICKTRTCNRSLETVAIDNFQCNYSCIHTLKKLLIHFQGLSASHGLTWQHFPAIPWESCLHLSDSEGISCSRPSSGDPTDFLLDWHLNPGQGIIKRSFSFHDIFVLLIFEKCLDRKSPSAFTADTWLVPLS